VLDLGSGTGDPDFGSRDVVGLDPVIEKLALSPVRDRIVAVGERIPLADGSVDGVFSGFVFRNLTSVPETLDEINRVLRPGNTAVVVDLTRPKNPILRLVHRIGTALVLPLVGLVFARAPREYWYLHRSLDSLLPPEELFAGNALVVEDIWRMGLFGFVYGVRLRKPAP
jgi:demethylmenaquinone methyltransferase/2-methoxy-6-polyprenyl-1,4-benzoquinol methylase